MARMYDGQMELSIAELRRLESLIIAAGDPEREDDRNIASYVRHMVSSRQAVVDMRDKLGYDEWGAVLNDAR
jgi:hypothetical protein